MNRRGEIKCIFFSEFHTTAGPKITYQVPKDYLSRDVFDSVHVYIITKQHLQDSIITINTCGHKIIGYPVCIENTKYERNALIFNLCFVFDAVTSVLCYEPVVTKLAGYLSTLERESRFLSDEDKKQQLPEILTEILENLNQRGTCSIYINDSTTIQLKVVASLNEPPQVEGYHVPILDPNSHSSLAVSKWDLATQQLLPYIDGFKHVAQIATEADVDIQIVEACIQNLMYYGAIKLISIFQYSNVYTTMAAIKSLVEDKELQKECIKYVAKRGRTITTKVVLQMYCGLRAGTTVRDLCIQHNPHALGIDERKLIQYGLMKGFIRRLHKYPIKLPNEPGSNKLSHLYRWFTGYNSYDEICCQTGLSYRELDDKVESDPSIVVCWK
ncbi:GATOR complex protein NPRL2 [Lamellibrachia satsuma]|nr:GATOR complex protein NPRL2 [Lamellibrachia satsuma]